jgi:dimethylargininase
MRLALTRPVSDSIVACELTHLDRVVIDIDLARRQHAAYEAALEALGCQVVRLPPEPDMPDAVFVEDVAVVLDELAVVARPGAASRRGETNSVAEALERHRPLFTIDPPGTIEGGDVLRVGRMLFVGVSTRTNRPGLEQFREAVSAFNYWVQPVEVAGALHLKSAVTSVGERTLLINRNWVDAYAFGDYDLIDVDPAEPFSANALLVGGALIYPAQCPRMRAALERRGIRIVPLDVSELAKAEGGVTCCSVIFET